MIGRTLFLIFAFCCATFVNAQRVISGTVYDEESNPLIGAKVTVKEFSSLKTVSDVKGNFSLSVPNNDQITLLVSFIGYKEETIRIKSGDNVNRKIYLVEDDSNLS